MLSRVSTFVHSALTASKSNEDTTSNSAPGETINNISVARTQNQVNLRASSTESTKPLVVPSSSLIRRSRKSEEINRLSHELNDLRAHADELYMSVQTMGKELGKFKAANRELADTNRTLQAELSELQAVLAKSQSEGTVMRQQLHQERSLRADDQQLLEMRTRELRDVQTYLTTVDTLPVQEIVSMVQALNSDIFQIAAVIAESPSFAKRFQLPQEVIKYAEDRIGHDITHLLYKAQEGDAEHRALVVQTIIQTVLAEACLGITLSWDAGLNINNTSLRCAYDRIRATSSQPVSARWRVLTRANVKYADATVVEKAFALIVHTLSVVLTISGWTHGTTNWETYKRAVEKAFGLDLERVVKDVVRLDRAMGEGLTSMDVELVTVAGGAIFDSQTMENGFDSGTGLIDEGRSAEIVGCTCDLGLQIRAGGREDGGVRPQMLLKPKVVLWATLLDAPQTDVEQI